MLDRKRAVISVVTISYNQAEFLERALTSVLRQQGVDVEYIVVDPGSTDGSREIIERYRPQLAQVMFEPDRGPADGLNRGLALATGDIFYFLNSDDVVAPGAFAEAAAIFQREDVDVVYGNGLIIDEHDQVLRRVYSAPRMSATIYALGGGTILQQAAFIRTSALRSVGGFNVENRTCWDGEAFFDMALAGARFRRAWRDWGYFRLYTGSISGGGASSRYLADQARIRARAGVDLSSPRHRLLKLATRSAMRISDLRRIAAMLAPPCGKRSIAAA